MADAIKVIEHLKKVIGDLTLQNAALTVEAEELKQALAARQACDEKQG